LPFEKVGVIMNDSDCIDVHKDCASVRVKFTKRPRSVFHKQSDMMILVATLMKGSKKICSTAQELIFRGGTGSMHSAEKKKKSRKNFKPEIQPLDTENPYLSIIQQNYQQENITNVMPYYPVETIETVETNMSYPINEDNNLSNTTNSDYNGFYYQEPYHQEIELDPKSFLEDFWANKGNFLPGFETLEKPPFIVSGSEYPMENNQIYNQYDDSLNVSQSSTDELIKCQQDTTSINNSNPITSGFSFTVNGSSFKDGMFQALIEGVFLDKTFSGTLTGSLYNEGFQGSFNSKFTPINSM